MKSTLIKSLKLNTSKSIYSRIAKNMTFNKNKNYMEPSNEQDQIEDVKYYLNQAKPEFLCMYFTNEWNPICKEANPKYTDFTTKTEGFKNLLVNVDKFPRVKWYYDCKFEPGFHLYYYGTLLKKIGGSNYDRVLTEMKRVRDYVDKQSISNDINKANAYYEQPYFDFEHNIHVHGKISSLDNYQRYSNYGLNYFVVGATTPFEENWVHTRLKQ